MKKFHLVSCWNLPFQQFPVQFEFCMVFIMRRFKFFNRMNQMVCVRIYAQYVHIIKCCENESKGKGNRN